MRISTQGTGADVYKLTRMGHRYQNSVRMATASPSRLCGNADDASKLMQTLALMNVKQGCLLGMLAWPMHPASRARYGIAVLATSHTSTLCTL